MHKTLLLFILNPHIWWCYYFDTTIYGVYKFILHQEEKKEGKWQEAINIP
jgi:hypothetical protein